MKVLGIIQARLGSERFPKKIIKQIPLESGMSMLELIVRKALLATTLNEVVVVTPDRFVAVLCNRWNVKAYMPFWEGRDVLREFYEAAKEEEANVVVRLTGDCAFIQPDVIDTMVDYFVNGGKAILYNTDESIGQLEGEGSDVEVFTVEALKQAHQNAKGKDREHVTSWIRRNLNSEYYGCLKKGIRSINTPEDYEWACRYMKGEKKVVNDMEPSLPGLLNH